MTSSSDLITDKEKKLAASYSLQFVENGMLLGLGSGTTVECLIPLLAQKVKEGLSITAVALSLIHI